MKQYSGELRDPKISAGHSIDLWFAACNGPYSTRGRISATTVTPHNALMMLHWMHEQSACTGRRTRCRLRGKYSDTQSMGLGFKGHRCSGATLQDRLGNWLNNFVLLSRSLAARPPQAVIRIPVVNCSGRYIVGADHPGSQCE